MIEEKRAYVVVWTVHGKLKTFATFDADVAYKKAERLDLRGYRPYFYTPTFSNRNEPQPKESWDFTK